MMLFFGTVFESLRFHLSTLKSERFQNDAFSEGSTFEVFEISVFISVFSRFTVDERQKCVKKYASSHEKE